MLDTQHPTENALKMLLAIQKTSNKILRLQTILLQTAQPIKLQIQRQIRRRTQQIIQLQTQQMKQLQAEPQL